VCRFVGADDLVDVALQDVRAGAHWVKILGDFPGPDGNWFDAPPNYPREKVAALVREVHAAGARVMAHSTGRAAPDLVAAGVDSIEHGMVLSRDLLQAMADKRIAWTMTLTTALLHVGALATQDTPVGAYIRGRLDNLRDLVPLARAIGVPMLAGTDEIGMGALARELQCLEQYGLSAQEALAIGSTSARSWLGFPSAHHHAMHADLVTYDDDPRVDLRALHTPAAIFCGGRRIA
jgi:imidazolonepropionase-like amidohydrolase